MRHALGWLLALSSGLLLGTGGRLYVLSTLVALYVYWWRYQARSRRQRWGSLVLVLAVPLVFGIVGMLRLGELDLHRRDRLGDTVP